jgi:multimeric flavodoxin WrbA
MNALVLDGGGGAERGGACRKITEAAAREFLARGWTVKTLDLDGLAVQPCRGCFSCWLKHPGTCAITDDAEAYLKGWADCDAVVYVTPVTFGGYSAALKKVLDRAIPLILPFFIKVHGEIHHPHRYDRRRAFLALGTLPEPDPEAERIFRDLVTRNAINFGSAATATGILRESSSEGEIAAGIVDLFRSAEIA